MRALKHFENSLRMLVAVLLCIGIISNRLHADEKDENKAAAAKSDLPALWKPRPDQFVYVEKLPYLGTGKLDLRRVKELGNELA